MAILSKTVPVKIAYNPEYYASRGYKIPTKKPSPNNTMAKSAGKEFVYDYNTTVDVKVEDLLPGSTVLVDVQCDYCGRIVKRRFVNYQKSVNNYGKYACCQKCSQAKQKQTVKMRYGVDSVMHVPEFKNKCIESQTEDNKKIGRMKAKQTMIQRYGKSNPMYIDKFKQKMIQTNIERYGGPNSHCSPEVVNKTKQTMMKRYGVECYTQTNEYKSHNYSIRNSPKIMQTMYRNGTVKCSSQQQYIYDLYKDYYDCKLNYPISSYAGDIVFMDERIDFEVDYPGHNLCVVLGSVTSDEFEQKQLIRDKIVEKNGYKRVRLISDKEDRLPSDDALLNILKIAIEYFNNTSHHWIEFYVEDNIYKSAIYPDGKHIDYEIKR